MPELSNTVRQRLGARPVPATHPDPDTLTAYVEQSLPLGERTQVVEHLAACSFCREVVALSLPGVPEQVVVQPVATPSRFWKFGFRWAGALAVVAIAITIGLVIKGPANKELTRKSAPQIAPTVAKEASASKATDQTAADQSPTQEASTRGQSVSQANADSLGRPVNALPRAGSGETQSSLPAGRELIAGKDTQNADAKAALVLNSGPIPTGILASRNQPQPIPAQPRAFVNNNLFEDRANTFNSQYSYNDARNEQARQDAERLKKQTTLDSPRQVAEQDAPRKGFLRKAVPIVPIATSVFTAVKTVVGGASVASDAAAGERKALVSAPPPPSPAAGRPPINPGVVSKQASTIPHEAPDTRRAREASSSPDQLHWRVQDGKLVNSADLNQWHEAYTPQGDDIEFKVVQAQGHEIWAGGTNTTLVHSWNGGVDWQKLNLGSSASGDIEKISVSGGDVQVKTSNGQSLISRDGGKTWIPLNGDGNPQK